MDEIIFELNENLEAIMVKKAPKYLRKHASQKDYVLRQLHRHNFRLVESSWTLKMEQLLGRHPKLNKFSFHFLVSLFVLSFFFNKFLV